MKTLVRTLLTGATIVLALSGGDLPAQEPPMHTGRTFTAGPAVSASPSPAPARPPRWQWELDLGYGYGIDISSEATFLGDVRFLGAALRLGRGVGPHRLEGTRLSGRTELLAEAPLWLSLEPQRGYAAGATLLGRYVFDRPPWLSPFVEIGAGPIYLDFDNDRSQADGFSFTLQGGLGATVSIVGDWGVVTRAHLHHISNAGLRRPNPGINDLLFTFGIVRRLR